MLASMIMNDCKIANIKHNNNNMLVCCTKGISITQIKIIIPIQVVYLIA